MTDFLPCPFCGCGIAPQVMEPSRFNVAYHPHRGCVLDDLVFEEGDDRKWNGIVTWMRGHGIGADEE